MRRPFRLALVVPALAAAACSPALDWREVRPEGGDLQVLLPCRPQHQTRELPLAGARVALSLHACSAADRTWAVAFADAQDPARLPAVLQALQAAAAANLGAGPAAGQALNVPGANPGGGARRLDLAGRLPDGRPVQAVVVLAARGTRVYQATAFGPSLAPQDVDTFVASLRLGAPAGAP